MSEPTLSQIIVLMPVTTKKALEQAWQKVKDKYPSRNDYLVSLLERAL